MTDPEIEMPRLLRQDVLNCSFENWYHVFHDYTFKSKFTRLPEAFLEYLDADGIFLPDEGQPQAATIEEIDSDNESTTFSDEEPTEKPEFPEIESMIRQAVEEFDGGVFPKLNWSSPRDAAWITPTQSLMCTTPFDVYLLLKSSDFINHDLHHAFDDCDDKDNTADSTPFHLVLRKWYDLQPSMEFRCFIKANELIGICQRDPNFYQFLVGIKDELEDKIHDFYEDHVKDKFGSDNFVLDVYIPRDRRKVWIVDFNPFSPTTDSLLYTWEELAKFDVQTDEPEFRIYESQAEADAFSRNAPKFAANMLPKDVIDLSDGRSIAEFAEELQRAMASSALGSSDDEQDESS